jgi:uncharacterized protein Yka (UPF0111/DUF47 family)
VNLFPRDEVFFSLLTRAAENMESAAATFRAMLQPGADRAALHEALGKLEHEGDLMTHEVIDRLNRTFITPIDREDIHALAVEIDDVVDAMEGASNMIKTYGLKEATDGMREQAQNLVSAVESLRRGVAELSNFKNPTRILDFCQDVSKHEKLGDRAFMASLGALFEQLKDPIELIKQKEICETIEMALDKAEDAANTIEGVVVKNA